MQLRKLSEHPALNPRTAKDRQDDDISQARRTGFGANKMLVESRADDQNIKTIAHTPVD